MAKYDPLPSGWSREDYIRVVSGREIDFTRYNENSLQRLFGYAKRAQKSGEVFDIRRGTGHSPKEPPVLRPPIVHHDYETEKMHRLPPHKEQAFRIPMLDDWYIGTCEDPPVLADVLRLLDHPSNRGAEFLYLGWSGYLLYEDGTTKPRSTSNNVSRAQLIRDIRLVKDLQALYDLLNPKTELDGTPPPIKIICQVSLRPAIERGGIAKALKEPPAPKEPEARIRKLTKKQREEVVKKHIEERKAQPKPKVKKPSKSVQKGLAKGLRKKKGKGL